MYSSSNEGQKKKKDNKDLIAQARLKQDLKTHDSEDLLDREDSRK